MIVVVVVVALILGYWVGLATGHWIESVNAREERDLLKARIDFYQREMKALVEDFGADDERCQ